MSEKALRNALREQREIDDAEKRAERLLAVYGPTALVSVSAKMFKRLVDDRRNAYAHIDADHEHG